MKAPLILRPASFLASLALALPAVAAEEAQPQEGLDAQPVPDHGVIEVQAAEEAPAEEETFIGLDADKVPDFLSMHLNLPADSGVLVRSLNPDGPAAKAGIEKGDILTKIDGKDVNSPEEMVDKILAKKPGDTVEIESIHAGKPAKATVTLGVHKVQVLPDIPGLENFPLEEQNRIRAHFKKMLKGQMGGNGIQIFPGDQGRIEIAPGGGMFGAPGGNGMMHELRVGGNGMFGTMKMMDPEGSIEMKDNDGSKEVEVCDKDGKAVWSGPWDTEQDKAAAPPDIRERIEGIKGGFGLNMKNLIPIPDQAPEDDEETDPAPEEDLEK